MSCGAERAPAARRVLSRDAVIVQFLRQLRREAANVLGGDEPDLTGALLHCFARDRELRVHLYGKQVRPGRKIGHVTVFGDDLADLRERADHATGYLRGTITE